MHLFILEITKMGFKPNYRKKFNISNCLENQLQELKKTEKNEKVLQLLSHLKF